MALSGVASSGLSQPFAPFRVRLADPRDFGDRGMAHAGALDFARIDVLAAGDDDVRNPGLFDDKGFLIVSDRLRLSAPQGAARSRRRSLERHRPRRLAGRIRGAPRPRSRARGAGGGRRFHARLTGAQASLPSALSAARKFTTKDAKRSRRGSPPPPRFARSPSPAARRRMSPVHSAAFFGLANVSRSWCFRIFPVALRGSAATISSRFGSL